MKKKVWNTYLNLLIKLGFTMLLSILIFFGIGLMLDRWFFSNGVSVIVGTFFGVGVGFYGIYSQLRTFF